MSIDIQNEIADFKRLLKASSREAFKEKLYEMRAEDIAHVLEELSIDQRKSIIALIEDKMKVANILSELPPEEASDLFFVFNDVSLNQIFDHMGDDDSADIIGSLESEEQKQILNKINANIRANVSELLKYDPETAGGIMSKSMIRFSETDTVIEVIRSLQANYSKAESIYVIYVVSDTGKLIGVCSLRQLIFAQAEDKIGSIMTENPIKVMVHNDQEIVAKTANKYDLLAVPVVDESGTLVGVVTIDDIVDVVEEEVNEDIMRMAGTTGNLDDAERIMPSVRSRMPWLATSWIGGILVAYVVGLFEETVSSKAYLVAFMPIILGMGGNVGTQASTVVVRSLALGRIIGGQYLVTIAREVVVGLILGGIFGLLLGTVVQLDRPEILYLGTIVGLSICSSMVSAALFGSLTPIVLNKLGADPAVSTGPFVTTGVDIISAIVYFSMAGALLN